MSTRNVETRILTVAHMNPGSFCSCGTWEFLKKGGPWDRKGYRGIVWGFYRAPLRDYIRGYIEKYPHYYRSKHAKVLYLARD